MKKGTDIQKLFQQFIKIEPKVMAVETMFNNRRRTERTDYKPPYQRKYVWDDEKATYFIESILLGTEIPPLIFFNSGSKVEVIDGRQRYETIERFIKNRFKLKKSGLLKLKDLANKNFEQLDKLKDTFWDTKLRIIEFSFNNRDLVDEYSEDIVKKEIFKRYNSGITPLRPTEIDKAKYIENDLNTYFKKAILDDKRLKSMIVEVFYFEKKNIEVILKKIRQLLVLHEIPISYYATQKEEIISKFFERLSYRIGDEDDCERVFDGFIRKLNYLSDIKKLIENNSMSSNRLISECLYWAQSIAESQGINHQKMIETSFKEELVEFMKTHITTFKSERSSFSKEVFSRYETTASFFSNKLNISFALNLKNNENFKKLNRGINRDKDVTDSDALSKFESLRLNKPDASSITIDDICHQLKKQRFLIRPPYQRNEVINKKKSSSIIESIMLGIKLPPIFVFKREDGVSEVIDGQQRLLSILGYTDKSYLDENRRISKSEKNQFGLSLKDGILKDYNGLKFEQMRERDQDRILDYDLWIIEIEEKNNPHFDPIDLFIRLNYKPFPIKENTFEMWNSYVDREIIERIKALYNNSKDWLYVRKNNRRMANEGLYTYLAYLHFRISQKNIEDVQVSEFLDIYKVGERIIIRLKSKIDITRVLESAEYKDEIIQSCDELKTKFIYKVKLLLSASTKISENELNTEFDKLLNVERSRRTYQHIYALWYFLLKIDISVIEQHRENIKFDIKGLLQEMKSISDKKDFDNSVLKFWERYKSYDNKV